MLCVSHSQPQCNPYAIACWPTPLENPQDVRRFETYRALSAPSPKDQQRPTGSPPPAGPRKLAVYRELSVPDSTGQYCSAIPVGPWTLAVYRELSLPDSTGHAARQSLQDLGNSRYTENFQCQTLLANTARQSLQDIGHLRYANTVVPVPDRRGQRARCLTGLAVYVGIWFLSVHGELAVSARRC